MPIISEQLWIDLDNDENTESFFVADMDGEYLEDDEQVYWQWLVSSIEVDP